MPSRVIQLELSQKLEDLRDLAGYDNVYAVLRLFGYPISTLSIPCPGGTIKAEALQKAIESDPLIAKHLANTYLETFLMQNENSPALPQPSWSIIVCTRNRTDDLRRCLESLLALQLSNNPPGEIIIVDNAPSDDSTSKLAAAYPVRYVREDRVGLNWARSHGARIANGEIVIFTDDDVVVDPRWVNAILEPFSNPRVAAVTGLSMPVELETRAQELFEVYGGFGRGFYRRAFDYSNMAPAAAGIVGAGANMALRTSLVNQLCLFDAELDSGTVTKTGGDTYAFYQLLAAGYQIVYNPAALVWHRHRREYAELRKTLAGYSLGGYAFLTRCFIQHGDWQALAVGTSWFYQDHLHQLARVLLRRNRRLPLSLVIAQIVSVPRGPLAYFASRKREQNVAKAGVKAPQIEGGKP